MSKTTLKQPEFNEFVVVTNSGNLAAAEYVCGSEHLQMGLEGYRLRRTIPGTIKAVERLIDEVRARASEYNCNVSVTQKSTTQWCAPYAICHETTITLTAK